MASLNVSMPLDMRRFVDKRTKATSHGTPTEYIRTLIREDQKRAETEYIEKLLRQGLESGPLIDASSKSWWKRRRRELAKRLKAERAK